ncbi:HOOK-domain-containing protein [Fistulina hepatica ATCC 64428]|nr:HOOK-domain-containing protein [Fistulina hepatica ATCC 64428]
MAPYRKETDAFLHFFATFDLPKPVTDISDLGDGFVLFQVLSCVDEAYFRRSSRATQQNSDNWVLRFTTFKSLYKLMTQYLAEVVRQPTSYLDVPDLQAIAKDYSLNDLLIMCRLALAIGVHCDNNKEFIDKIQQLGEADQHHLMKSIERTGLLCDALFISLFRDDHYYRVQSEKSQILSEKEALRIVYEALLGEHRALQTNYDDLAAEKVEVTARLKQADREVADSRRGDKADVMLKAEIDRLRSDLQKSEDNLAMTESELDKQTGLVTDLTKKVDELQVQADITDKLKDQLDEYRHAADKLQKTENVMEKYKKKLQEGADLRQHVKALEKQNADLVDKNASLEEEFRKVAAFKPLMESYKNQISDLEAKSATRTQEVETLKFELEQSQAKFRIMVEERNRDSETLELYQERVRELELSSHRTISSSKAYRTDSNADLVGVTAAQELTEDDNPEEQGLGGELDDAISGTTMTDLKLKIKKLTRELEAVRKNEADASRLLVMENLLEDANRMKARYEADYLAAHREKLVLQRDLEEIRSGKAMGDGVEAAIALRQRLNEIVDELDALRKEHAELEVKFESQFKDLTIAKSDLNLVNRDQLDILANLRDSVNEDKAALEAENERLRSQNKELSDKNKMQLEQVNNLLLEKINLQSEGIDQRERMIQRERDFGDLRRSLAGKDLPEDIKARMLALHEENENLKEVNKTAQDKLQKARQFIKEQDKLFKAEHARSATPATYEEAENSYKSQIKVLENEITRHKHNMMETRRSYRKEQELMMSAFHALGMKINRYNLGSPASQSRPAPASFLGGLRAQGRHTVQRK